jgi:hypothetical protein
MSSRFADSAFFDEVAVQRGGMLERHISVKVQITLTCSQRSVWMQGGAQWQSWFGP